VRSYMAQMFDISRPTAYKFIHRYETAGLSGLLELSRRPRTNPNQTPDRIEEEILRLRNRHPRWGAPKLAVLLEDRFPGITVPAVSTISAILKRNGMVKERRRRKRVEPVHPIFDPLAPNEVWSADFKGKFRMGNKVYCYPLTIADSYSRYVFAAKGMHHANTKNSKPVFIDTFRNYGMPLQIHTDNGAPFAHINSLGRLSKLGVWFMELGIKPVYSDPSHPDQNGRHERMHRELKAEATKPPGYSLQPQQRKLNSFVKEYNELRPHEALGMKTPVSIHRRSERTYPEKIDDWVYPSDYKVKYITRNGAIRVNINTWLFVTTALMGKYVGLEELGNGIYRMYFREFLLGYVDMKELNVHDIMTYKDELDV
jgi:transposase InsO family protein